MAWEYIGVKVGSEVVESYRPETRDRTATYTETAIYRSDDICNESETTLALYMQTLGHPEIGTESANNPGFYCIGRTFTLDETSGKATVAYEYSTHPNGSGPGGGNQGPTGGGGGNQDAPEIDVPPWAHGDHYSWSSSTVELPMTVDASGDPIVTSANEFIPGWTMPHAVQELQITRYMQSLGNVMGYASTICNHSFRGYQGNESMMSGVSADEVVWNNLLVWKVTFSIRFLARGNAPNGNPIGWFTVVPDYGTVDSSGVTAEQKYGLSHQWLQSGTFVTAPNANTWQYYNQYPRVSWTALGLDGA